MPASVAGSSITGSSDNSLDFELAFQNDEDDVDESQLNVLQRCWRAINIPFEIQVVGLMTVPILCLIVFSSMIFGETIDRRNYITDHGPLINSIFDCATKLVDERFACSAWLYSMQRQQTSNMTTPSDLRRTLLASRAAVDESCLLVGELAFDSSDDQIATDFSATARSALEAHKLLRYRVDVGRLDGTLMREQVTKTMTAIESGLAVLAQSPSLQFESLTLLQLRQFRLVQGALARSRITGYIWISALASSTSSLQLQVELRNCYDALIQSIRGAQDIASGFAESQFSTWVGANRTVSFLAEFERIGARRPRLTADEWLSFASDVVFDLRQVVPTVMNELTQATALNTQLRNEGIKLSVAVVMSLVAAVYIIRAQIVSSRQIGAEVQESKKLHKAVTKFVPKSFLKLMGCTSVTHIVAGDQTEVGVAMLFADIHDFNAMTATMSGDTLFDWLEVYFEQMSTITDNSHGFVDKFIGDAMFCVFMNATEAVEASIRMQAMTDQLNGEIVCGGGSQLIQIGIGIHQAVVSAGILGDSRRHTCTLVSSDVNLASRLEGLTKFYGSRIIVSSATIELCDRRTLAYRRLGSVKCKGRLNGVEICEIFQTDPLELKLFKKSTMEEFTKGVDLQLASDTKQAAQIFERLKQRADEKGVMDLALQVKLVQSGPVDEMTKK